LLNRMGALQFSTATFRTDEPALNAWFSPASDHIITADARGDISIWSPTERDPLLQFEVADSSSYLARPSAAGALVVMSEFGDTGVWDAATGEQLAELELGVLGVADFAVSADGHKIATASLFGDVQVWDAATGDELVALVGHEDIMHSIAFSPDDQALVTTSSDGTARVWDASTGEQRLVLTHTDGHSGDSRAAFSPDSRFVATLSTAAVVRIWDAMTGKQVNQFTFPDENARLNFGEFVGLAFSADGRYLVTSGAENGLDVSVWEVASGTRVLTLENHRAEINSAGFSPDALHVVTTSQDGTAQTWDLRFLD
ncbi:MAG: WD40 repeat domain-containing protein, partial [Anaerolineae bacterium]|nr:WD40 repeat domain-containing protein [Anaerolineae bacterium]